MKNPFSKNSSRGSLMKNTLMLYILTFSNYFLGLIVAPYETRVLGAEVYGLLGAATAVMVYFQLIIDFGFLLSGTQDVALHREDTVYLSRLFTSITCGKLILTAVSGVGLTILCRFVPVWQDRLGFYALCFLYTALNSLIPDYLYRGLERMSSITVRTVCIKVFFTLGIVLLVKAPEDVWLIPVLTAIGNGGAMLYAFRDVKKRFGIGLCAIRWSDVAECMKKSSVFFYSRIATTAYSAMNTLILDVISGSGAITAYYTSADKLITTGKSALSPISDSLYPYMVKNRDFKLVKKVLMILEPLIFLFCAVCFIFAEPLCGMFFGAEFAPAGKVLRAMLPVGVVILPSYILGFPMMSAMGISKHANYSVIFGSVIHIINLLILWITGNINMVTLGISVSVAETLILSYRIVVIWRNRHLLKKEDT